MSHLALLAVTAWLLLYLAAAAGVGTHLTTLFLRLLRIKNAKQSPQRAGVQLAVGLTALSYLGILLGVWGQFRVSFLVPVLILAALTLLPTLPRLRGVFAGIHLDWYAGTILTFSLAMLATVYLSAMQPPHTSDELNYHFPEAATIVATHHVDLRFGGHFFYGNIPKTMEVLYAEGLILSGPALAHALHFSYLLAFLLVVYGVLSEVYGARAGVWGVCAILLYDDLTWNMTSGFVDGAAFAMEISGLLLTLLYLTKRKDTIPLVLAGAAFGIGASIKYSVFVTAAFAGILLLPTIKRVWQYLLLPGAIMGGFWYVKNMLLFGNPFYPLYFGHPGVTDAEYRGLLDAIQEFKPKTWASFVSLMDYFRETARSPVFIAMTISPLALFGRKKRGFATALFLYFVLYVLYWFFLGTHQLRFFAPAALAALILAAIFLSRIPAKLMLVGLAVLTFVMYRMPYFDQSVGSYFWGTKFHLTERQYALGHLTQDEFMYRWYGCYYSTIRYLDSASESGSVIDNWSYGTEFNLPYFSKHHSYIQWSGTDIAAMQKAGIRYLYVRDKDVAAYTTRVEPWFHQAIPGYKAVDTAFIAHGKLIKEIDDCRVWELTP